MIKKFISFLFVIVVVWGGALLYYSWYFQSITIEEKEMWPYTLVYEAYTGDYASVQPVIDKIYDGLLYDFQIKTTASFGIYYDNLASSVGVVVGPEYSLELSRLRDKYNVKIWNKQKALVAEFPYKSPLSIIVGVMKVYPEYQKYVLSGGIQMREVMEIYDRTAKKIFYVMPIK